MTTFPSVAIPEDWLEITGIVGLVDGTSYWLEARADQIESVDSSSSNVAPVAGFDGHILSPGDPGVYEKQAGVYLWARRVNSPARLVITSIP